MTREIFNSFFRSLNVSSSTVEDSPYIYVDTEANSFRVITDLREIEEEHMLAYSVMSHGDIEVLTTEG
ncbi:MAG: hypothetical protein ACPGJV_11700 [Bacteriovoracaceae bacterium]